MGEIGNVYECRGETTFEWKVENFFSISDETNIRCESPKFYFSGASWKMRILPNGEKDKSSEGFIGSYVIRMSAGLPLNLTYSMGIKNADGKVDPNVTSTNIFDKRSGGWGTPKILSRSVLNKRKSAYTPSCALTVVCTMKSSESIDVARSIFTRHQEVCDNMTEIFTKAKRTDFTIKVDGQHISAHRMILETRSPVFAAMFNHDTEENQKGEISIIDIDKDTVVDILKYMYSGEVISLSTKNALKIYSAAEKYDLKDLKQICLDFIITNLSEDCVCDVMEVAELYEDKEMAHRAIEYFKENASKILESDKWNTFATENPDFSNKVLSNVVKAFSSK